MTRFFYAIFLLCLISCNSPEVGTSLYEDLNTRLLRGWNTFDVTSISTQVLLPEGLSVNLAVRDTVSGDLLQKMFTGNTVPGSEKVWTIAHTPDGSYTDFVVRWRDFGMRVQTCAEGEDLYALVTPADSVPNPGLLELTAGVLYGRVGEVVRERDILIAGLPGKSIRIMSASDHSDELLVVPGPFGREGSPALCLSMEYPCGWSTKGSGLSSIREKIAKAEADYIRSRQSFGDLAGVYDVVQNAMNWQVIHDNVNNRLITPVARPWAYGWGNGTPGGYVLFCWDNFFAAFMHSLGSRELAFNEAIQMCREIDGLGFVPNFSASFNLKSRDRSQPPVGGMMVREIYLHHPEKWFLEETFDRLVRWNRWWDENRCLEGYLCWGSDPVVPVNDDPREQVRAVHLAASFESGLDNTPMYEDAPFDTVSCLIPVGDVGLMGLYVGDCEALAYLARELGRNEEESELAARGEKYREKLRGMWDEDFGMFLNRRIDEDRNSYRISPTNFYALVAKAATQEQAERMIREHFYNPEEFWGEYIMPSIARNDPSYTGMDYWKGSIWAPMNFLVYMGMRNYDLPGARADLAAKSRELLLDDWNRNRWIRENYHGETGGDPGSRSEHFYHWGALLGMIDLMENGDWKGNFTGR